MFENYEVSFISKSSMNESVIRKGRPYGGNAIIWKSDIKNRIIPVKTFSNRLTCIHVHVDGNTSVVLYNVCMPCDQGG